MTLFGTMYIVVANSVKIIVIVFFQNLSAVFIYRAIFELEHIPKHASYRLLDRIHHTQTHR